VKNDYEDKVLRWLPLLAAALFLLLVTVPFINHYGLWFDEIFSVAKAQDIDSIIAMVRTQENNMLLHYLLLWLWLPLGDGSEMFLRTLSVAITLLALFPLHAATRRLADHATANTACLVFASHFLVLEHAWNCRGYALAALMSALVLWRWTCAWQTRKTSDWLVTGVFAGLAVWSHYFGALVLPVLVFAMLWRDGWKQPWRQLGLAGATFFLVALPIVLTRPPDGTAQIAWADVPSLRTIQGTLWILAGLDGLSEKPVLLAVLVACVSALLLRWRRSGLDWRHPAAGLLVGLLLVVLSVLVESFVAQPLFVYRFFTPLVPVYCVVLACALAQLWPWLRVLLLALLLSATAWETSKVYAEPLSVRFWWKPMVQQMMQGMKPDDVILVYPSFLHMPVDYYLDRLDPAQALPRTTEYASGIYREGGGVEPEPDWWLLQVLTRNTSGNIWLVTDEKSSPSWTRLNRVHALALRKMLLKNRQLSMDVHYSTMTLQRFDVASDVNGR